MEDYSQVYAAFPSLLNSHHKCLKKEALKRLWHILKLVYLNVLFDVTWFLLLCCNWSEPIRGWKPFLFYFFYFYFLVTAIMHQTPFWKLWLFFMSSFDLTLFLHFHLVWWTRWIFKLILVLDLSLISGLPLPPPINNPCHYCLLCYLSNSLHSYLLYYLCIIEFPPFFQSQSQICILGSSCMDALLGIWPDMVKVFCNSLLESGIL